MSIRYYSPRRRKVMWRGDSIDHVAIFERDGWVCQLCGLPIDPLIRFPDKRAATLDHIIPIEYGGAHIFSNVQASHGYCNEKKARLTDEIVRGTLSTGWLSKTANPKRQDNKWQTSNG